MGKEYVAGMSEKELREKYNIDEVVKIGSNENPLGPSPRSIEAVRTSAAGLHRYPPMSDDDLRDAIADSLYDGIGPEHLITGNGGCDVLSMAADAFLTPGDECIICRPTFPVYEFTTVRNGAQPVFADLDEPDFTYNPAKILDAITPKTRIIYICSPNNPTGTLMPQAQFDELFVGIPENVVIIFDEVYHHFVTATDRPDAQQAVLDEAPIVAIHSFSKAFGLAGCRLGYGVARPDIAEQIRQYRLPFHINNVTFEAGLAALEDKEHLAQTISTVIEGRTWIAEKLSERGMDFWPSQGNFVLFKPDAPAEDILEGLQKLGVIVRPMDNFYLPGYLRVSAGRPEGNQRFIDALDAVS